MPRTSAKESDAGQGAIDHTTIEHKNSFLKLLTLWDQGAKQVVPIMDKEYRVRTR
jgi:hypothetical protein